MAETTCPGIPHSDLLLTLARIVGLPGLMDMHVHLREPGYEYKEDVESGLRAAAWGGFSNIMCMANTKPVNDCRAVTELMLKRASEAYRKVRNTCRYLVSNLHDFDPDKDGVDADALQEIDRYALSVHDRFVRRVLAALAEGQSQVSGVLFAEDTAAMLDCISELGAGVDAEIDSLQVDLGRVWLTQRTVELCLVDAESREQQHLIELEEGANCVAVSHGTIAIGSLDEMVRPLHEPYLLHGDRHRLVAVPGGHSRSCYHRANNLAPPA